MKNIILLFSLLYTAVAYSQDCGKLLESKIEENLNVKSELNATRVSLELEKKSKQDTINKINEKYDKRLKTANDDFLKSKETIARLENEKAKYNKAYIDGLEKDLAKGKYEISKKVEEGNLLKEKHINELATKEKEINLINEKHLSEITKKNQELNQYKAEKDRIEKEKEVFERQLTQLANWYKDKPLDSLIAYSSLQSVTKDIPFVKKDADAHKKTEDLVRYFRAKQVLDFKYNEAKTKEAQAILSQIQSESYSVKKLTKNISDYSICHSTLISTFDKIKEIDNKVTAEGEENKNKKSGKIEFILTYYVSNYIKDFHTFPHLANIVIEAMSRKSDDANADLSDLRARL